MHAVRSSLRLWIYIPLSILNALLIIKFIDTTHYLLMFSYFLTVQLNQYFLVVVVADMTGSFENNSLIPTWLMAVTKLLILIAGILVAVHYLPNKVHIIVGIYIFQLIILAISTKRVVKKN